MSQSMLSHQWSVDQWESTLSCANAAYTHNSSRPTLRRTWSDPGVNSSAVMVESDVKKQSDVTVVSIESSSDLSDDSQEAQTQESYTDRNVWSNMEVKLEENDSYFGRDELVHIEDYYYDDEDSKSQVLSFKNCSLRIHGIILLILIYAAGYLAYTFAGPSKRKCLQVTTTITQPYIP